MDNAQGVKSEPCRYCGCTDTRICPGGCYWYDHRMCSSCAIKQKLIKVKKRKAKVTP